MSVGLLWVLVCLDAAFAGFRDAAGRNPRIQKARWYARAMGRGLLGGQLATLVVLCWVVPGILTATDPSAELAHHMVLTEHLVQVYGTFAAIALTALAAYLIPHPDISALATVMVLGPFTLARPWVIVVGAAWAAHQAGSWRCGVSAALAAAVMLLFEWSLGRRWREMDPIRALRW